MELQHLVLIVRLSSHQGYMTSFTTATPGYSRLFFSSLVGIKWHTVRLLCA